MMAMLWAFMKCYVVVVVLFHWGYCTAKCEEREKEKQQA